MFRQPYLKLISLLLVVACAAQLAVALPTSYYASGSLLSSGKWVKVKVSTTGMQEISFDKLRALGFSDPSKVAVYGYSGIELRSYEFSTSMPDDLPAVPVASYGDKLVFYGVASEAPAEYFRDTYLPTCYLVRLLRNLNNDCSYYFLTDSRPRLEVVKSNAAAVESLATVEKAHGLVWKNFTDRHPDGIGAYLFGENIAEAGTVTYTVYMPGYDPAASEAPSMSYGVAVKAASGRFEFSVDGATTRFISVQGYGTDPGHLAYRYGSGSSFFDGMTKNSDDIYKVTVDPRNSGAPLTEASLDYYAFSYPRNTDVSVQPQQLMSFQSLQSGQPVKLLNATSDTKVWEVSPSVSPRELTVKSIGNDGSLGFVIDRRIAMSDVTSGLQTIAFDPARELCQVEVMGEVAPQNYHGMDVPQMLVVASEKTYDQALELARLHEEKTGVEVAVVPFLEICNEFASGLPHPMAIRRLAKMLYDRNPAKFQAVLLFAKAFNDNTGNTATETRDDFEATYIPMFQCEDTYGCGEQPKSYSTDALYGMLSDNFVYDYSVDKGHFLRSPLDVKVGRVPAANADDAFKYLQKVRDYLDNHTDKPLHNRALMISDYGDENLHLQESLQIRDLLAEIAPETMMDMHLLAMYAPDGGSNDRLRRRISQLLQRGIGLWFFLGHSQGVRIGHGLVWSNAEDAEVYNENPPFTVFGTCSTLALDSPASSLQVDMLFNENGGMIAGVGATRPTYAQYNVYVCDMMARSYYAQKPGATLGDVYRDGRNLYINSPETIHAGLTGNSNVAVNTMCYNFAGDPMLPLRVPQNSIEVRSFNSVPVGGAIAVNPLEKQRIEGVVLNESGEVDTSFTGELAMSVYDGRHTVTTAATADADNPVVSVDLDESLLQEVKMAVNQGRFSGEFEFAVPTYSGQGNRVSLYAVTSDLDRSATGSLDGLSIDQNVPAGISVEAPVISSMYAADEEYAPNDYLPGDFMLYATVDAGEIGLIGSSDRFGGGVSVTLDDSKKLTGVDGYFKMAADGSATLAYPVSGLADGTHQLMLRVVNVAGVSAERSVTVNVVNVADAKTVVEDAIARQEAVIDIEHQLADAPVGRLVVLDAAGHTVFSKENVEFPYSWNLTDNDGSDVADGLYSARVYFKAGRRYGFATPAQVVVGR